MRFAVSSPSGALLMQRGVAKRELAAARVYVLNFQVGAAITLPVPFFGPVILIKSAWLVMNEKGELTDTEHVQILCHEFCHVRQILDWGTAVYMARHLWARVRTRSLLAKSAPEESECYEVTRTVEAHYRGPGP